MVGMTRFYTWKQGISHVVDVPNHEAAMTRQQLREQGHQIYLETVL